MAISALEYFLLAELAGAGILPPSPAVLELGESNWYGDVPVDRLAADIRASKLADEDKATMLARLDRAARRTDDSRLFDIAKISLSLFTGYRSLTSIDLNGASSFRFDLNRPVPLDGRFDLILDFGTAEHVFNIYQLFKTVHDRCRPGGLMIHGTPFTGWIDHGFYSFQPTFYWDLAAANGYAMKGMLYGQLQPFKLKSMNRRDDVPAMLKADEFGANGMIFAVLQSGTDESPFQAPMQGYYAGALSDDLTMAWQAELRYEG